MKIKKCCEIIFITLAAMLVSTSITACADMNDGVQPRRRITSCPPGEILICETRRQELSKGGAEEEIPQLSSAGTSRLS